MLGALLWRLRLWRRFKICNHFIQIEVQTGSVLFSALVIHQSKSSDKILQTTEYITMEGKMYLMN